MCPPLAVLVVIGKVIRVEEPGRVCDIQHPFTDRAGKTVVVPHHGDEGTRLLRAVHEERIVVRRAALADQPRAIISPPVPEDRAPLPERAVPVREAPVHHLRNVVGGPDLGVHPSRDVGPVRELELVRRVRRVHEQRFEGQLRPDTEVIVPRHDRGHVQYPRDRPGSLGLRDARVVRLHRHKIKCTMVDVGKAPRGGAPPHGRDRRTPSAGHNGDPGMEVTRRRVEARNLKCEHVGHRLVPPVIPGPG